MQSLKIMGTVLSILLVGAAIYQSKKSNFLMDKTGHKKVNVWDTYVTKKDGNVMHFDILAPVEIVDTSVIYNYGKIYLKTKGQEGQPLTSKQCRLCHVEHLRPEWEADINRQGFYIIEMEGCN